MAGTTASQTLGRWILVLFSPEALNYLNQLTSLFDWWKSNFSKKPRIKISTIKWETENVTEKTIKYTEDTNGYHREVIFSIVKTCRQNSI